MANTVAGVVVGSPGYMSPEQAAGKPLDVRSDVYSFGVVLHELLSGVRASDEGEASRSSQAPPALARIVQRCLAANPRERFQTMAEVRAVLEHASTELTSAPGGHQPSIAVLPFANMSADKENEYFGDGLAEEVINALAQVTGLQVAGRTSSFQFRGKDIELAEVGRRLNVHNLLEGSVRRAGNRVRVTAQLIKVSDGFHLWSERYDWSCTVIGQLAALLERAGDRTRADALLETLGTGEAYGASTGLAIFHAMRGDAERSAEWAAQGIAQRFLPLVYMVAPLLKSERQWPALARLLNLPASGAIASA